MVDKKIVKQTVASQEEDATDALKSYLEYNKILRAWFVAFGVGGPALLLVNDKVAEKFAKLGSLKFIAALFLIGATAQVLGAFLNKIANWYVYMSAIDDNYFGNWQHGLAEWLIHQFWIDIFFDVLTIICFGAATWQMITAFA